MFFGWFFFLPLHDDIASLLHVFAFLTRLLHGPLPVLALRNKSEAPFLRCVPSVSVTLSLITDFSTSFFSFMTL